MGPPSQASVLLIDDEQDLLEIMQMVLRRKGITVHSFGAPPDVDTIAALDPKVIFLDMLLKGVNGKDVCRSLKASTLTRHVPVIMLSAHSKDDLQVAAATCGADGFLSKPFDIHDFARMAQQYMERSPDAN